MSHDLHSLIDQAVEQTKQPATARPVRPARELLQGRLAAWQAEVTAFAEEFERAAAQLRDDLSCLQVTPVPETTSTPPPAPPAPEEPERRSGMSRHPLSRLRETRAAMPFLLRIRSRTGCPP